MRCACCSDRSMYLYSFSISEYRFTVCLLGRKLTAFFVLAKLKSRTVLIIRLPHEVPKNLDF